MIRSVAAALTALLFSYEVVVGQAPLAPIAPAPPSSAPQVPKTSAPQVPKTIEQRLDELERRVNQPGRPDAVEAVAEVAKMTMEAYKEKFDVVKWVAVIASLLIALMVGGFAFFGFRQFRQVVKPLRRDHRRVMAKVEKEEANLVRIMTTLEEQTKSLREHEDQARRNVLALIHLTAAFMYVEKGPAEHVKAMRDLDKALEQNPSEPKVLAWAYSMQGYLLRRLKGPKEGLAAMEKCLEYDPSSERALYNAACYAALLGLKKKWIEYLRRAIELSPQFARDAVQDHDFESVQGDPDFLNLTGRG